MSPEPVTPELGLSSRNLVAEVLARWPATTAVFVRRGMACPGCVMAPMMTVEEAAAAYRLDVADLLADLVETAGVHATS